LEAPAEVAERLIRDEERLLRRRSHGLLGEPDLLLAERWAVRGRGVLLVRAALGDVGPDHDQRRAVLDLDRRPERPLQLVELDALLQVLDVPAVGLVALRRVLAERQLRIALD